MDNKIKNICLEFGITGTYMSYEALTNGHINTTYKVSFKDSNTVKSYVLQCVNTNVFKNPIEVMENIFLVTSHIKNKIKENKDYERFVLNYKTSNNKPYYHDKDNTFWRCYDFIDNSITFNKTDNLKLIEEAGK